MTDKHFDFSGLLDQKDDRTNVSDAKSEVSENIKKTVLKKQKKEKDRKERLREEVNRKRELTLIKTAILKGLQTGESIEELLFKALKGIAVITDDKAFYRQSINDLEFIYGNVFKNRNIEEIKLFDVEKRLTKLKDYLSKHECEMTLNEKSRIKEAITAHKRMILQLEKTQEGYAASYDRKERQSNSTSNSGICPTAAGKGNE